jgi:glycine cleavage system H protein
MLRFSQHKNPQDLITPRQPKAQMITHIAKSKQKRKFIHAYHQLLAPEFRLLIPFQILPYLATQIRNMNYPDNLRYTKEHEWIRLEGDEAVIGITEFAQHELGDIVYVEIETVGKDLNAGEVFGTVEAVKTVSDLYLPVAGSITEVNPNLNSNPELVNTDPYGGGWMVKMKLANPADAEALMDAAAYGQLVG